MTRIVSHADRWIEPETQDEWTMTSGSHASSCEDHLVTLISGVATDETVTIVGDRRGLSGNLFASASPCKIQALPNCPTAVWGFAGANILAPEIAERVDDFATWEDVLASMCSALRQVNLRRDPQMQVSVVLGGLDHDGEPTVLAIDPAGEQIDTHDGVAFVGTVADHARTAWKSFMYLKDRGSIDERLDAIYRGLVDSGSVAVARPLDVATITTERRTFQFQVVP